MGWEEAAGSVIYWETPNLRAVMKRPGMSKGTRISVGVRVRIKIRVGVWFGVGVAARVRERR